MAHFETRVGQKQRNTPEMVSVRVRNNHGVYASDPSLGEETYQRIVIAPVYDRDRATAINHSRVAMAHV